MRLLSQENKRIILINKTTFGVYDMPTSKSSFKKLSPKELRSLGLSEKSERYRTTRKTGGLEKGEIISKRKYIQLTTGQSVEQRQRAYAEGAREYKSAAQKSAAEGKTLTARLSIVSYRHYESSGRRRLQLNFTIKKQDSIDDIKNMLMKIAHEKLTKIAHKNKIDHGLSVSFFVLGKDTYGNTQKFYTLNQSPASYSEFALASEIEKYELEKIDEIKILMNGF